MPKANTLSAHQGANEEITFIEGPIFQSTQIRIHLNSGWASTQNGYRLKIRRAILDQVEILSKKESVSAMNLKKRPRFCLSSVSVSHCPQMGGFAVIPRQVGDVGLDLEVAERVSPQIIQRVSDPSEFEKAELIPAMIWSAKEASYKAWSSRFGQTNTLSNFKTHTWQAASADFWHFECQAPMRPANPLEIAGSVMFRNNVVIAYAIIRSTLV